MKVKYYLRGMGVGILITTLIFIVSFALYQPTMSDEEIIAAAKQLGMVEADSDSSVDGSLDEEEDETEEENNSEDAAVDTGATATTEDVEASTEQETQGEESDVEYSSSQTSSAVDFSVKHGESSRVVSQNLFNLGLVDDADAFDKYLNDNGYDNFVQPGNYSIPMGSSYSDVATIITQGKLD